MKLKILFVILIFSLTIFFITYAKGEKTNNFKIPPDLLNALHIKKEEKIKSDSNESLFKNKHSSTETEKIAANLAKLAGPSHNQYGIRDDIFKFIETNISPDDKAAYSAVIKLAADDQFIYFKATPEEALKKNNRTFISTHCFFRSMPREKAEAIYDGLNKLLNNTPERKNRIQMVDETYFGWHILGYGDISNEELNEMCITGNY